MSRIRTNLITNRMANGAPTVSNGLVISGVTTSTTFSGSGASLTNLPSAQLTGALPALDGSNLTGITGTTINNNADNRIITGSGTANTLEGESTLNYGGNQLTFSGAATPLSGTGHNYSLNIYKDGGSGYGYLDVVTGSSNHTGVRIRAYHNGTYNNVFEHTTGDFTRFYTGGNERLRITNTGHTLFSGLTAHNDPRNANGITLKSTSGVSFQNYGSNGSRNWRIRPDDQSRWGDLDFSVSPTANSATDWPDAASDKVLTLGYDGTVTKPRQPYFKANLSSGVRITSTGYVTFGAAVHNNGSYYNTSDGKFTAPVTGLYWFSARINAYDRIDFTIRVNGSDVERGQYNTDSDDVGWWSNQLTTIVEMTAGQYAQVHVNNLDQAADPGTWCTFMGYLVC